MPRPGQYVFWHFFQKPRPGAVYNAGGGRQSNCSIIKAIALVEELTGNRMNMSYHETNRVGDHIWWISDLSRFLADYPYWEWQYDTRILSEIVEGTEQRVKIA